MIKKVYFQESVRMYPNAIHSYSKQKILVQKTTLEMDFEVHTHDFQELVVITGGKGLHVVGDQEFPIAYGDIYVMKGDVPHGFKDVSNLSLYNIIFKIDQLPFFKNKLKELAGFQALFILEPYYRSEHNFESRLHLSADRMRLPHEILQEMVYESNNADSSSEQVIEAHFNALVSYLSREYAKSVNKTASKILYFAETAAYMERNYTEAIELKTLSSMAYFSVPHFVRSFKKIYGTTPMDYLIRLRIEHACTLLKTTESSIAEISCQCGFNDSNYFCRAFKKKMGKSPSKYRESIKP